MNKKGNFQFGVGVSSILMIFVVLCLTTFGVLSYVTANADKKISTKNAETVENYYAGVARTEEKLQEIDSALFGAEQDAQKAASGTALDQLDNYDGYKGRSELEPVNAILKSGAAKEQKLALCYRKFAEMLLSRQEGVTVDTSDSNTLNASFVTEAGGGRQIETKLTVNAYGSTVRYQVTGKKLVDTQSQEIENSDDGETLDLWQGNSAQ